jgi:small subunit ribosomal protein S6
VTRGNPRGRRHITYMRLYELLVLVHPDTEPAAVTTITEDIQGIIQNAEGEVVRTGELADTSGNIAERADGDWKKRRLAYLINDEDEAYFVIIHARMNPDVLPPLERNLRLNESILRHMFVRLDEETV